MFGMHPVTGPEHFERRIEIKERLQKVLLIPESAAIKPEVFWIFQGHKDVVHVHDHSRPDAGQDL
jgi:hypothetical protein